MRPKIIPYLNVLLQKIRNNKHLVGINFCKNRKLFAFNYKNIFFCCSDAPDSIYLQMMGVNILHYGVRRRPSQV